MIKEALQYLIGLGNAEFKEINGQMYSTRQLDLVPQPRPAKLVVRNLTGLVDYLNSNYDDQPPTLIQVLSPTEVNVYSTFNKDMQRNHLIQATALLPDIPFERFLDTEQFNILLQSCFVPNDDSQTLLKVVGNVVEEAVRTTGDNGVTQTVTAKKGIATIGEVTVPNPVVLKPFRTFSEVTQPESKFVFRMKDGPLAALFEADGGAWKLDAIEGIRDYLAEKIKANATIIA